MKEALVRDHFAATFQGTPEYRTEFGRVDVLLPGEVVEVEPFTSWRHGVRQALAYAQETGRLPALALYGSMRPDEARKVWAACAGLVRVYMLDRETWVKVESDKDTDRSWRKPPDDLQYRPPKKRQPKRLTPEQRVILTDLAYQFGVSLSAFRQWPEVIDWVERTSPDRTEQLDMFAA